jgi:hypothetical protein
MICSLNLDLSSFEELFPILGPLTTQLTLLNKNSEDNTCIKSTAKSQQYLKFL